MTITYTLPPDSIAPKSTIALDPASPNGQNGWYTSAVKATVSASDETGGTGVAETRCVLDPTTAPTSFDDLPSGCDYTGAGTSVSSDGQHTLYAASKDEAGNEEQVQSASFKIDQTTPTVSCDEASPGPIFVLRGAGGNVSATVSDATSGPVDTSVSAAASVSSVGNKSVSLTGTDEAGNSTTVGCPYRVEYGFSGFLSPVPQTSYMAGSTIPVKFKLQDASGMTISNSAARALVAGCNVKVLFRGTTNCATYNATTNTFQFNLKTPRNLASGSYTITVEVSAPNGSGVVNEEPATVYIRR